MSHYDRSNAATRSVLVVLDIAQPIGKNIPKRDSQSAPSECAEVWPKVQQGFAKVSPYLRQSFAKTALQ